MIQIHDFVAVAVVAAAAVYTAAAVAESCCPAQKEGALGPSLACLECPVPLQNETFPSIADAYFVLVAASTDASAALPAIGGVSAVEDVMNTGQIQAFHYSYLV
jgi:hypothetical protein